MPDHSNFSDRLQGAAWTLAFNLAWFGIAIVKLPTKLFAKIRPVPGGEQQDQPLPLTHPEDLN